MSFIRGVLQFTVGGRIRIANANPTAFNGGTPSIPGPAGSRLLCGFNNAPEVWVGGVPYTQTGGLCLNSLGPTATFSPGGVPLTANGEVAIDSSAPITHWLAGIPFTAGNKLAVGAPEVPTGFGDFQ